MLLSGSLELDGLDDWDIWWGADLGTPSERLVAGRVGEVRREIETARATVRSEAGWVMDIHLLRRPAGTVSGSRR